MPWLGVSVLALQLACSDAGASLAAPSYAEARRILDRHCVSCHSEQPIVAAFPIAPNGVVLDTPAQMRGYAERIKVRAVIDRTMPLLNKTEMTDTERGVLGGWVEAGAALP